MITVVRQSDPSGRVTRAHHHPLGQLVATTRGLVSIGTERGRWIVPPRHGVWLPPWLGHDFASHGPFEGWSLYVAEEHCQPLPAAPRIVRLSALLSAAAGRAAGWADAPRSLQETRLAHVVLDEIALLPEEPLGLPLPQDPRLARIAAGILMVPDGRKGLEAWAREVGMAPRTITRRFPIETGFSFSAWSQRARVLKAIEHLAAGLPVTTVAFDLGYETVSSFIALFKAQIGVTPGRYMAQIIGTDGAAPGGE